MTGQPILLPIAYLGPILHYALIYGALEEGIGYEIEACENYVKQSFRNRALLLTPNRVEPLQIPIESNQGRKGAIREVRLSEHDYWRHTHLQAILSAYGSAPYFEYYWPELASIISSREIDTLWELDRRLMEQLLYALDLPVSIPLSTTFRPLGAIEQGDFRYHFTPKKSILELDLPPYYSHFGLSRRAAQTGQLSILDLLFNMGPESQLYLRALGQKIFRNK